jgi:methionyl-tRNA formyltransferase
MLGDKVLKVFESTPHTGDHEAPGTLYSNGRDILEFSTTDGVVRVKTLQLEGKRRMATEDFLRGTKL